VAVRSAVQSKPVDSAGLGRATLDEIEIRGEKLDAVRRNFVRPQVYPWNSIRTLWGFKEI
jgi:hypothetical protein